MGKALELSSLHGLLSEIREKLKKVDTKEQLDQLRAEVLSKIDEKEQKIAELDYLLTLLGD